MLLQVLIFGAFNAFWAALPTLLGGEPYHLGGGVAGAFGIIGAVGAMAAATGDVVTIAWPGGGCAGGCSSSTRPGVAGLSHLYGHFGLVRLTRLGHDVPWVKARSFVREPDAGNLPVQFDERGVKTGPWPNQ
jgi:hypothetical protein